MAFTTHPNQLDSKQGLRAGLIGLAVVAFAAVAALGFSVVDYDSTSAPAAVDFPTVDEMRAENMEIRRQIAVAHAATEAPAAPVVGHAPTERDLAYAQEWARRVEIMEQQAAEAAAAVASVPVSH